MRRRVLDFFREVPVGVEDAHPNGEEDFPVRGYEGDSSYYRGGWDDNEESSSYYRWDDDEESDDDWEDDAPSDDAVATH